MKCAVSFAKRTIRLTSNHFQWINLAYFGVFFPTFLSLHIFPSLFWQVNLCLQSFVIALVCRCQMMSSCSAFDANGEKKACNGCILESISCYLRCRIFEINVKTPLIGMLISHCDCIWFFFLQIWSRMTQLFHWTIEPKLLKFFLNKNNWIKRVFAPFPSNI